MFPLERQEHFGVVVANLSKQSLVESMIGEMYTSAWLDLNGQVKRQAFLIGNATKKS